MERSALEWLRWLCSDIVEEKQGFGEAMTLGCWKGKLVAYESKIGTICSMTMNRT